MSRSMASIDLEKVMNLLGVVNQIKKKNKYGLVYLVMFEDGSGEFRCDDEEDRLFEWGAGLDGIELAFADWIILEIG